MFFPESQVRVWLYNRPTDMRKSYIGLVALVKNTLEEGPLSGRYIKQQTLLGEILKDIESPEVPETETNTYERRKKHRPETVLPISDCASQKAYLLS